VGKNLGSCWIGRNVPDIPLAGEKINALRARGKRNMPVVLSKDEARKIIMHMTGRCQLMAKLLYGSRLRFMECLRLGVHDLDFDMKEINARDGKGGMDSRSWGNDIQGFLPKARRSQNGFMNAGRVG